MPVPSVIVVGGGVVGAAVAYELLRAGAAVTLLERGVVGAGASHGNTGWISPAFSYPLAAPGVIRTGLRAALDPDGALVIRPGVDPAFLRWLWAFRRRSTLARFREATRHLKALNDHTYAVMDRWRDEGVPFEQHDTGLVLVAHRAAHLRTYVEMFDELRALGVPGISDVLPAELLVELEPALDASAIEGGVHVRHERFVQPRSLTDGLVERFTAGGGVLLEGVEATSLVREGDGWRVLTPRGDHRADRLVVAAGHAARGLLRPLGIDLPMIGAKGYSVTAVGTGTRPRSAVYLAEAKVGLSGYDDATRIAGVFELNGRGDVPEPRRIASLVRQTRAYLRDWDPGPLDAVEAWTGYRPATPDGLPRIGESAAHPGLFLAVGHGMLGVTLAAATAELLAPVVLGAAPPPELAALRP